MTDETQRMLGKLEGMLDALRSEHDRHAALAETNFAALRSEMMAVRLDLASVKAEGQGGSSLLRHAITAVIAALAGFGGGHTPIPGAH